MHDSPVGGYSTKFCFYLVNLFNRILDTGKYPALWSFGLIVPIHKKDDRSQVENYRGITLLSALGKLFTSIILYKRLCSLLLSLRAWSIDQFFVQKQKLKIDRNIQFLIFFLNSRHGSWQMTAETVFPRIAKISMVRQPF